MDPEKIDVLDKNGNKTGDIMTRDEVHRSGLWHRIAVAAILDDKNHILLQKRSQTKLTNPNKWDIAAAGHVDAGEDALATIMRETAEEIGITASNFQYILSYQTENSYQINGTAFIDKQIFDCFILREKYIDPSKLKLQTSEVQAVKLCSLKDFQELIQTKQIVNRLPFYEKIIEIMKGNQ